MKLAHLLPLTFCLLSCSEDSPPAGKNGTKPVKNQQADNINTAINTASGVGDAIKVSADEKKADRMMADFSLASVEEISELLNKTKGNLTNVYFLAKYKNYLSSLTDVQQLSDALRNLDSAPYKTGLLQVVFMNSKLTTPDNIRVLQSLCKNKEEIEQLALGVETQLMQLPVTQRLTTAQSFLDSGADDLVAARAIKVAIENLVRTEPAKAENWLLDLPPEVAEKADGLLLAHYAASSPKKGTDFINRLIQNQQIDRALAAVRSFGYNFSETSPEDALNWANALPDSYGQVKVQILVYSFGYIAKKSPNAAKEQFGAIRNEKARTAIKNIHDEIFR